MHDWLVVSVFIDWHVVCQFYTLIVFTAAYQVCVTSSLYLKMRDFVVKKCTVLSEIFSRISECVV